MAFHFGILNLIGHKAFVARKIYVITEKKTRKIYDISIFSVASMEEAKNKLHQWNF